MSTRRNRRLTPVEARRQFGFEADERPAHYKRDHGPCRRLAPCGNPCTMEARHDHFYHSCSRAECANCHGSQRFQRGMETA